MFLLFIRIYVARALLHFLEDYNLLKEISSLIHFVVWTNNIKVGSI